LKIQEVSIVQDNLRSAQNQDELKNKKVYRAMRLLESSFNPEASKVFQDIEQWREIQLEQANVALFTGIVIDKEPSIFDEAWNHDDPRSREKWKHAMKMSFVMLIRNKFGRSLGKRIFQSTEEKSSVNGSSR
jgi:hypothetical protein